MSKVFHGNQLMPIYLDLPSNAIDSVFHYFGHFNRDLHLILGIGFIKTFTSLLHVFFSARAYISFLNCKSALFLRPTVTYPLCSSKTSDLTLRESCKESK